MQIITPTKRSREIKLSDLPRVFWDSLRIKFAMIRPFPGRYPTASSISHCQIEAKDPLRFFVLGNSWHVFEGKPSKLKRFFGFPWARTIINPRIVAHGTKSGSDKEGCMSFADQKPRKIKRWQIVDAEYSTFFGKRKKRFWLYRAALLQHEVDHMDVILTDEVYRHNLQNQSSYERP